MTPSLTIFPSFIILVIQKLRTIWRYCFTNNDNNPDRYPKALQMCSFSSSLPPEWNIFFPVVTYKAVLSKTQKWVGGKLSSMGFFLQRPEKKISVNSFTWGGTILKELGRWLFTDHLERILIFFQLDDVNKDWLWNKFCESEDFSGLTVLVVEGKLLYLISCLNMSIYIGQTFSLFGDMPFADKCFPIQTGKHPWSPAPLVR